MTTIIKGIKLAVGDYNRNQNLAAIMYFDKETGEVWTNVYASENEWSEYHSKSIVSLQSRGNLYGGTTSMEEVRTLIARL